jgi:hypothetical protein
VNQNDNSHMWSTQAASQPTEPYVPVMPPGYAGYVAPAGPPVVPPIAPPVAVGPAGGPVRSSGFWIALTGIVSALVVIALLGGYFIGQSTRLSNADVQTKINQQAHADQLAQQRALDALRVELNDRAAARVRRASARAERRGLREGRAEGRQAGFEQGRSTGFSEGQSSGYASGQQEGYSQGLDDGSCIADFFYC